jgi:aryl-alcohol dehydrogenase-like predicted oxidoreductase
MRFAQLGRSGLTLSVVGLGGNNFGTRCDQEQTRAVVAAALDVGINHFDSAEVYGRGASEEMLGRALAGHRHEVVIATKFGYPASARENAPNSRRYIRSAVEASLKRLNTDYIDLYYQHAPDARTPWEETLEALDELITAGKVRYIGACAMDAWQVVDAEWTARTRGINRFVAQQADYSLLNRTVEAEVIPACARCEVGLVPFFPLANGLLTGKYRRGEAPPAGSRLSSRPESLTDDTFTRLEKLERFAADRGASLLQLAIGGLIAQPMITSVIAGATTPEQVRSNAAAGDWTPSLEDMQALAQLH